MNRSFLYLAMLGMAPSLSHAETRLPETVVTASRLSEPVSSSHHATTIIDRTTIEKSGARDASELLARVAGIQVGRNGGQGQQTSLFIRGTASDHALVLIDGVPAQSGTTGATAIQHIDPALIERIEVVRGPASTLYGTSAVGGVIQIFTRDVTQQPSRMHASLQAGNEASLQGSVGVSGSKGPLGLGVNLSHQQTTGYPTRTGSTVDRGYRHDSFDLKASYELAADTRVLASHWHSRGTVEYLDFFSSAVDQDVRNSISSLALETTMENWDSQIRLSHAADKADENQSADFAHTTRWLADWQNTVHLNPEHTLVAGVSWAREKAELLSFGSGYNETSRSTELYLQDNYHAGDLGLVAGVRGIHHSEYGNHGTWNLGASYQLTGSTHLHANAGTAFRSPSANDLYGFGGNPDFEPEKSRSAEIGIRHQLSDSQKVSLNLFHTRITDLIEVDPATFVTTQVEEARIRGVELGYQWQKGSWLLDAAYTWQNPENLDQDTRLARRAENKLNIHIGVDRKPWWVGFDLTAESERLDSRFSNKVMDAYGKLDLNGGYRLNREWSAQLDITNLFDTDYELADGFPAQGRLLMLGLHYVPK